MFGQIAVTQAMLPALRARARADRVRVLDRRTRGDGLHGPYAASKHAIEAFGDALRVELHSSGVQVALIEPGSVATPIWDKSRGEADSGERSRRSCSEYYGHVPAAMDKVLADTARRGVPPEQVAETIERALTSRAHARALRRRPRRARDAARQAPAAATTSSTGSRGACSASERALTPGGGYTASQANRLVVAACVWSIPGARRRRAASAPFQEQQVQALAVGRARLGVAGVVGRQPVERAVALERVQREHPLQVDRVVLR